MSGASRRINELRRLLHRANRAYYVDAAPTMTDAEFDALLAELARLEADHPQLDDPNSPTRRVGGEPIKGFTTLPHALPMLSVDNTYSEKEVHEWIKRVNRLLTPEVAASGDDNNGHAGDGASLFSQSQDSIRFIVDPKIDGVALSLRYERGRLVRAMTRGDGRRGDDVTANARAIGAIPLVLDIAEEKAPDVLEVRGEACLPLDEFDRVNREREEADQEPFMNPRNACAGAMKQLDPRIVASRKLTFIAHGCGVIEPSDFVTSYSKLIETLASLGVPTNTGWRSCEEPGEIIDAIHAFETKRHDLPFAVDGVVVRVDRFDLCQRLGATAKSPRWCIAFKYPAQRKETKLLRVDMQVGKTGRITPRAVMAPVLLAGTTVQRATLHNFGEIRRKDIRIGDTVVIEKAGEIIPQVIEPVLSKRSSGARRIKAPDVCPECDGPVEVEPPHLEENNERNSLEETGRRCVNPECPAQIREKLIWFAARGQMDIDGLGESTIDQIRNDPDIPLEHFADVFRLKDHRDKLLKLPRMGSKKVDNLLASIERAKSRGLARVLSSLGVRHVGAATARALSQLFADLDELLAAPEPLLRPKTLNKTEAQQFGLPPDPKDRPSTNLGKDTAPVIYRYLHSAVGRDTFEQLRKIGVDLTSHEHRRGASAKADSPLFGATIVLTGSFECGSRLELTDLLTSLGAFLTSAVSNKTSILIAGKDPGSKLKKAKELGVPVWDEQTLREHLPDASPP